jgi:uncharacterized protein YbaA (DUF1428 family)
MTYVEGFILAVPTAKKDEFREHAADAAPLFREFGVTRHVETWGDDLPDGTVTDFRKAVQAREDETVAFSWFEYPDRETRDAANQKMMTDPRMEQMGAGMPFDGKRMIIGGFSVFVDEGGSTGSYTDGFVLPIPDENRQAYHDMALKAAAMFREHGAVRLVEAWGDDVPDGKLTDFRKSVQAQDGESVVFSWVEWLSKESRDEGWKKIMADERMKTDPADNPFDGKRMFWGGFQPILDTARTDGGAA